MSSVHLKSRSPGVFPSHRQSQAKSLRAKLVLLGRNLLSMKDPAQDLPIKQLKTCMALVEKSRAMSEISREIGVSTSAMTQIADRLQRAGLVVRVFEGSDRRMRKLQLTSTGQRLMRARQTSQLRRMEACLERLNDVQVDDVLSALDILAQNSDSNETDFPPD